MKSLLRMLAILAATSAALAKLSTIPLYELKDRYLELNYSSVRRIERTKGKDPFSFAVIGDPRTSQTVFGKIIEQINRDKDLKFVILLGDITQKSRFEEYMLFLKKLSKLQKPVLVIPGNHDIHGAGRVWFYRLFGPFYFSLKTEKAYFILMDTSEKRHLFPFEVRWLEAKLKESQKYTYRFVFMHIPPYDPREGKRKIGHSLKNPQDAETLLSLFSKYKVTAIFCSHIHTFISGNWDSIPFYITGGAGCDKRGPNPHYLKVRLSNGQVKVSVVHVPMKRWELTLDRVITEFAIPAYIFAVHNLWYIVIAAIGVNLVL